ncbi:MAG: hypothetical protein JWP00_2776 [Chloroflexi bacterium]|nr:hypothetical protein [Chloroflexota bacterium]
MFCPSCGTQNERGVEKCTNCGKLLPQLSPGGDLIAPPSPGAAPETPAAPDLNMPGSPGPKAGQPGSQYAFGYNQPDQPGTNYQPGPYYNPAYPPYTSQPGNAPYYNYSLPVDHVGVAPAEVGFWPRLGAYVIDNIILSLVTGLIFGIPVVAYLINFIARHQNEIFPVCDTRAYNYDNRACNALLEQILIQSNELSGFLGLILGLGLVVTLITVLYYTILTARGATIGKKVFGMKVVREDGAPIGFWRSLLRHTVGYFVSAFFFGLGFIWIGFDPHKQGWHDKIASTYVVRARP